MVNADVIVIGGGAAGLMAAAAASNALKEVGGETILLEKMPRPGRKIMITGKGRCNFTNVKPWNEFSRHVYPKAAFLKPSFYNMTSEKLLDFFADHGLEYVVERGDRAFPSSHLASDVVDTLVRIAEDAGAKILCGKEVTSVEYGKDGGFSIACSDGSAYGCQKLVVCTGGLSYPKTGSTGDGYRWAREAGHKVTPLFPSLTALVPRGYKDASRGHIDRGLPLTELGKSLCGNQLKNVGLSVVIDGNVAYDEFGDLDFTDGGLEGPLGFKVSRKSVCALINGSKVQAVIDLKPAVEVEELHSRIARLWDELSKDRRSAGKTYKERFRILLPKLLPVQIVDAFLSMNPGVDHKSLARMLKSWKFQIDGYVGYERCVVTAGGVSLDEVAPKTMESKIVKGLYFAGEVLDLDCDTGGYNLQTAFSTGYLAGVSAAKR